ncbi:hypothetical protein [Fimbriiglobus ruber]|uniref:Uncharacterized protein n=1 Tax=Fimbriiglobus ruber TaxID=1908690 RepID=A0A225DYU1_9BACT|nr:hypothetical protein [Fimbriiglobus ruber]OWK42419.1 hypothetical protein FRUB_04497 [Fimbriiglobus ruber]
MTNSPAHKIRIGSVSAIIWRNPSEKGAWYSLQITRSYKNGDDEWRNTDALGYDDALTAAKLLDLAHTWITHQLEADRKGRKEVQAA